jgi:glyoxalase family protein
MTQPLPGIHHITAITGDARRNKCFYAGVLGLRLVKRTANVNDPSTVHLYYGNWNGSPGTLLTFFVWPEGRAGRHGTGAIGEVALTLPRASLAYWIDRLLRFRVQYSGPLPRFGEQVLSFRDDDGLLLELVVMPEAEAGTGWDGGDASAEHAIRGIHHVRVLEAAPQATGAFLTGTLGFRPIAELDGVTRYAVGADEPGTLIDVQNGAGFWQAAAGAGVVHHVAWRTPDREQALAWRSALVDVGLEVTPLLDRRYFESIYAREPGGVLFEIATDGPGFTVDEALDQLGTAVQPPPSAGEEWIAAAADAVPLAGPSTIEPASASLGLVHHFVPAAAVRPTDNAGADRTTGAAARTSRRGG